jgi:phosphoenolpyruvate synthase/pyruvate phosphate dikinase
MNRSKGKTLLYLKKKRFNVPNLILVNSNFFLKNNKLILTKISKKFKNKKVAVRSSSINEDTLKTTNAGKYKSILNIPSNDSTQLNASIEEVIKSYKNNNFKDEVIIQEMLTSIKISGVCTTVDIYNYSPVITINYFKGNNTEIVTSGRENSYSATIADIKKINKKNIFFKLVREVEKFKKIFKTELLDIEFAIDKKNKLHILQVRNLILSKNKSITDKHFYYKNLERLKKKINKLQKKNYDLFGNTNYFGVMPDWNPAEIIGTKPRPLAMSMYKELIQIIFGQNIEKIMVIKILKNTIY